MQDVDGNGKIDSKHIIWLLLFLFAILGIALIGLKACYLGRSISVFELLEKAARCAERVLRFRRVLPVEWDYRGER